MKPFAAALLVAGAVLVALPAQADDAAQLQTKIRAALRSAKSFVETVRIKPNSQVPSGGTIVYTVVAPDRFRQKTSGPEPGGDDTIVVGREVYGSRGVGVPWDVQTWSPELVAGFERDVFEPEIVSIEPDAPGGLGSFMRRDPNGFQKDATLSCTYDKSTFRPQTCSSEVYQVTYSNYDDPAVSVPVPLRFTSSSPAASAKPVASSRPVASGGVSIVNSGSTNVVGYRLELLPNGELALGAGTNVPKRVSAALARRFFADLRAAGPLDRLPATTCMKSASFGSWTRVTYQGKTSPDLSCPSSVSALRALAADAAAVSDAAGIHPGLRRRAIPLEGAP